MSITNAARRFEQRFDAKAERFIWHHPLLGFISIFVGMYDLISFLRLDFIYFLPPYSRVVGFLFSDTGVFAGEKSAVPQIRSDFCP